MGNRDWEETTRDMADPAVQTAGVSSRKDDFMLRSHTPNRNAALKGSERRMHLRAFDYWHDLHNDTGEYPDFQALTPDGLSPFKENSLLLEVVGDEVVVRYCGSLMRVVFRREVPRGATLSSLTDSAFAHALEMRLLAPEARQLAAEFEYEENDIECRGIMLPFNAVGHAARFLMVVVNHRPRGHNQWPTSGTSEEPGSEETESVISAEAIAEAALECSEVGARVVHPDSGTREMLYEALADTYRFHTMAAEDPAAYKKFLRSVGLRQQVRAPFTPALKLTFGKSYDKTRLTEYAAALSYAACCEVGPDDLVDFLKNEPGGIKGCVHKFRAMKQTGPRSKTPMSAKERLRVAQKAVAKPLSDISLSGEFDLVLARRGADGRTELLGSSGATKQHLDQALARMSARGIFTSTDKDGGEEPAG